MESDGEIMERDRVSLKRSRMDFEDDESTDYGSEYNGLSDSKEEGWWREDESEDLDCEEDIEDHEYTTSGDTPRTVKIRLFLTDEAMGEFKWMKNFIAVHL
ncbi:hypothetical protein EMGR_000400 [Emarellia grisea]|uniref:Uncharacterized protein n=2 Tax=Aspergillus fumigatus TaxID=746128 RepID=B0YE31_ASPFC|nr:hypothetical protein AFUB_097660 [Aspergillus fumigatus A1163]